MRAGVLLLAAIALATVAAQAQGALDFQTHFMLMPSPSAAMLLLGLGGLAFALTQVALGVITAALVPEPSTAALGLLGLNAPPGVPASRICIGPSTTPPPLYLLYTFSIPSLYLLYVAIEKA